MEAMEGGPSRGTHELCSQNFRPHGAKRNNILWPEEKPSASTEPATLSQVQTRLPSTSR